MIAADNIRVRIGASDVLRGVNLNCTAGQVVAVVGANGAGKTTLLRALSGLLPLQSGSVSLDNEAIDAWSPHRRTISGLVHVPQGRQIIPMLTVRENLLIGAEQLKGLARADTMQRLENEFARFPVLRERAFVLAGALSGGEQQMLAISRGLMMRPRVLMLDEPSLGLAPRVVSLILRTLRSLADQGMAVLLVEQAALGALGIADRGLVMRSGQVVLEGTGEELLGNPSLVRSFLG